MAVAGVFLGTGWPPMSDVGFRYLELVNETYRVNMKMEDLPQDGSDMIVKRVEKVLQTRFGYSHLDKEHVIGQMLKRFDTWHTLSDLPAETRNRAERLFQKINAALLTSK